MKIKIVKEKISLDELREIAKEFYLDMVKGVVDVEKEIVAFGGEYHADSNEVLIKNGSKQSDIWGFNIVLDKPQEKWLEYTSLINIRPADKNTGMFVEDKKLRDKMKKIVDSKIE